MLLVAHPAIGAVLLAEAIFGGVPVALEQESLLGFHGCHVVGMHAGAPELGILEIFVGAIAEQPLDILADESRRIVAARLEAVDHRGRGIEQKRKPLARAVLRLLGDPAGADVAPRAHDLRRAAPFASSMRCCSSLTQQYEPSFLPEAIFDDVLAGLEQLVHLGFDARQILRMHPLAPEIRVFEIFGRGITEQPRDVLADKGRREIALGLEAVDHRGRGIEQPGEPRCRRGFDVSDVPTLVFVMFACCVRQDTLNDIGHFAGIGAGLQHLTKRGSSFLSVFSGGHRAIVSFEVKRRPQRPLLQGIVSGRPASVNGTT